jgi:nucleobase:cation symporter-1, NCS1 family
MDVCHSSYGMKGAYFAMVRLIVYSAHARLIIHYQVIRGVVCVIWYGVQGWLGGNAVLCMLDAIWPSFTTWHIHALPESAAVTAAQLLSFTIFWLASLPFLYLSVPSLRWIFMLKVLIMPPFGIALFTWALTAGNGWGPLFHAPSKISNGWTAGYVFALTITAAISPNASESNPVGSS